MRRLVAVVIAAFLAFPLLAATSAFTIKPNVIVYPFIANGSSIDREASSRLATIFATQMATTGLVTVIAPPPGTERKDYLSIARANSADYYVSGYISALGNGVSVVEQVVSATTGIVVFSQSAQLDTYAEAAGQGDDLARFIARHANRGLAAIGTPPPQAASPTPGPSSGPEANLGKLFGRRKKPDAKPSPSPTPRPIVAATAPAAALVNVTTPPAPARVAASTVTTPRPTPVAAAPAATPAPARTVATAGSPAYAVLAIDGTAEAALREYAAQRLAARTGGERAASAAAACAAHAVRAVLGGNLAVKPDAQFGDRKSVV